MSKSVKLRQKILSNIPLIILIPIMLIWIINYPLGLSHFNKDNAVSIFGSIIQGMSALLSVAIAVIIFRIQSLENRNQQLEESTLNFIFQITRLTYTQWEPSVEENIRNGTLTNRYYDGRVDVLNRTIGINKTDHERRLKELQRDRDAQQERLEKTLNRHTRIDQTIRRTRTGIFSSMILLMMPILFSFLLLMVSDALDSSNTFYFVSIVVLMSATGIAVLIKIVLESTVQSN